jgi:hypothetical protein
MDNKESDMNKAAKQQQEAYCASKGTDCAPTSAQTKSGFALTTKGAVPINGLRHPPQGDTSGWYIWCGKEFSTAPDFFAPLHTEHIYEDYPQIVKFLGLPPGYRFLVAGDYEDVWYDPSLLNV